MATARPRTAGLRVPFTPNVEERDENEAHILRLQLPEFKRQQVTVRVQEGRRVVKVTGERQAGDNRWFRFDETYPIPQICLIDKISVQLKDGVLSIKILKQTTGLVTVPEVEAVSAPLPPKQPEQLTLVKGREEILPKTKAEIKESGTAAPTKGDSNPAKASEENKGIFAELQKQGPEKAKEEAPTPAAAVAGNDSVKGGSGETKTTVDQKTEAVGKIKNEESAKIGTGTQCRRATRVGRMSVAATVSLAAAVVMVVAAYFAYT